LKLSNFFSICFS